MSCLCFKSNKKWPAITVVSKQLKNHRRVHTYISFLILYLRSIVKFLCWPSVCILSVFFCFKDNNANVPKKGDNQRLQEKQKNKHTQKKRDTCTTTYGHTKGRPAKRPDTSSSSGVIKVLACTLFSDFISMESCQAVSYIVLPYLQSVGWSTVIGEVIVPAPAVFRAILFRIGLYKMEYLFHRVPKCYGEYMPHLNELIVLRTVLIWHPTPPNQLLDSLAYLDLFHRL